MVHLIRSGRRIACWTCRAGDYCYRNHLHPSDRILIISAGLTESHDPSGKLLGGEGMKKILSKYHNSKGLDLFDHLLEDLKVYAATQYFNDDVSAVMVEYHA